MRIIVAASLGLALTGCVQHTFAPGPGMSATDFDPDSARCRLFSRGAQSGFEFGAYGNPKFVAGATAGAALGYAIGSAIERNENFNDCMQARGWRIADGAPSTQDGAMTAKLASASRPEPVRTAELSAPEPLPVVHASYHSATMPVTTTPRPLVRRDFLVRAVDVTPAIAASMDLNPPHGVEVLYVDTSGAAWSGGIRDGDIILSFNGSAVTGIDDMQSMLSSVAAGAEVSANIWRNGTERSVGITF